MPEGHTIHRLARDHTRLLVGAGPIEVTSPQGRFAADAALVDGAELRRIEAYGKHLSNAKTDPGETFVTMSLRASS